MKILYYVTDHGLGHASRTVAIIREMKKKAKGGNAKRLDPEVEAARKKLMEARKRAKEEEEGAQVHPLHLRLEPHRGRAHDPRLEGAGQHRPDAMADEGERGLRHKCGPEAPRLLCGLVTHGLHKHILLVREQP